MYGRKKVNDSQLVLAYISPYHSLNGVFYVCSKCSQFTKIDIDCIFKICSAL